MFDGTLAVYERSSIAVLAMAVVLFSIGYVLGRRPPCNVSCGPKSVEAPSTAIDEPLIIDHDLLVDDAHSNLNVRLNILENSITTVANYVVQLNNNVTAHQNVIQGLVQSSHSNTVPKVKKSWF